VIPAARRSGSAIRNCSSSFSYVLLQRFFTRSNYGNVNRLKIMLEW
jgi:hypothetical protein